MNDFIETVFAMGLPFQMLRADAAEMTFPATMSRLMLSRWWLAVHS